MLSLGVKGFSVLRPSLMGSPPLPPHARLFSHMHFYFPFLDICFINFRCFSFLNFGWVIQKMASAVSPTKENSQPSKFRFIFCIK
jgi:hypothetical protein